MNLYEINHELEKLIQHVEFDENGEVSQEFQKKLKELHVEKEEKVIHCARAIKNIDSESCAIKNEIESLAKRKKRLDKVSESIENYLTLTIPGEQYKDSTCEIGWRKSIFVRIDDEKLIPKEYIIIKSTLTPDKITIKEKLKSGEEISGASLAEKNNLQIK